MNVVPLQTGGMVNFVEISSLVWLVRSTEFSILLLPQFRRLRNVHSVFVENYTILTRFYVQSLV